MLRAVSEGKAITTKEEIHYFTQERPNTSTTVLVYCSEPEVTSKRNKHWRPPHQRLFRNAYLQRGLRIVTSSSDESSEDYVDQVYRSKMYDRRLRQPVWRKVRRHVKPVGIGEEEIDETGWPVHHEPKVVVDHKVVVESDDQKVVVESDVQPQIPSKVEPEIAPDSEEYGRPEMEPLAVPDSEESETVSQLLERAL